MSTGKAESHPILTAAFYEMLAALLVLAGVLALTLSPKLSTASGVIGIATVVLGLALVSREIHKGRITVPVLDVRDRSRCDREYEHIRKALFASFIATVLAAIGIATLILTHHLVWAVAIATVVIFNVYGWFSLRWWREACSVTSEYKKAIKEAVAATPPIAQGAPTQITTAVELPKVVAVLGTGRNARR